MCRCCNSSYVCFCPFRSHPATLFLAICFFCRNCYLSLSYRSMSLCLCPSLLLFFSVFFSLSLSHSLFRFSSLSLSLSHSRSLALSMPLSIFFLSLSIYIYIYMDTGASGAAILAHFFIFPHFYSEKSRFRDAAAVPHFFFFFGGAHLKKNTYFCRNRLISKQKGVSLQKWAILGLFGEVSHTQTEISQKEFNIPRVSVLFPIKHD